MARKFHLKPIHKSLIYLFIAFCAVMGFRLIIPGGGDLPIAPFAAKWRVLRGVVTLAGLFPALVFSAFVVPFGYRIKTEEDMVFTPGNFSSLAGSVARAITAACVYSLLLFFVTPMAEDALENMRAQTKVYNRNRAGIRSLLVHGGVLSAGRLSAQELSEAMQLLAVCEHIWPEGREISAEKNELLAEIEARKLIVEPAELPDPAQRSFQGQRQPANASEAMRFANTAMDNKRYFDAHWLAGLAARLAPEGSVERNAAARLASQAWAMIEQFEPSGSEIRAHDNYRLKREGYEAMTAGDWIRGYYIFLELKILTPNDPDVAKFIAKCEEGLHTVAFFLDEVAMTSPILKTDAIFSIPRIETGGRVVLHAGSISVFSDVAYAIDVDALVFNALRRPVYRVTAPFAKIMPVTIGGRARSVLYMRALDRTDRTLRWEPVWENAAAVDGANGEGGVNGVRAAELLLDIPYEDLLLASDIETADTDYRFSRLRTASTRLGDYGFTPEQFSALEIRSVSEPLMLLPLSIFSIILGWRYRVRRQRARYSLVPMLVILPVVFNLFVQLCRHLNNIFAIWAVLELNHLTAIITCAAGAALLFILTLAVLAFQKDT